MIARKKSEEEMKDGNEICANCLRTESAHDREGGCYGAECVGQCYTPSGRVSVPKDFVEAVRELCDEIGFCTCHETYKKMHERGIRKYDPACVFHNLPSAVDVRSMLDQIDGKDGGE